LAYISAAESIRVSSTTFTQSAQKATEFGEIKQPLGLLCRSRSFKVTDFGTDRKLTCDFLLVINTSVYSYLAPFLRYSPGKVQNRYIWLAPFRTTSMGIAIIHNIPTKWQYHFLRWSRVQPDQQRARAAMSNPIAAAVD